MGLFYRIGHGLAFWVGISQRIGVGVGVVRGLSQRAELSAIGMG